MRPQSQPPTPGRPGVEGFGPGRHLHGASLCSRVEAASWFRAEVVGSRLGGSRVPLRPLRTWNGERASGEDMRLCPEGEPSSCPPPPPQRSWRHQVTGWPGGGPAEVRQRWHGRQNRWDRTQREAPSWGQGLRGTVPAPTRPWDLAVERTAEGGPGPNRRVGRRKGQSRLQTPRLPAGLGNQLGPSSRSTECKGTDEMETRTAGGMTWPASHCPLLGRVIPSTADVSSGAKERIGRERGGEREKVV